MEEVPESLLLDFFQSAKLQLEELVLTPETAETARPPSLSEIRELLLTTQLHCLDQCVCRYNDSLANKDQQYATVKEAQGILQQLGSLSSPSLPSSVQSAMDQMNEAARVAFVRLVLYSECLWESNSSNRRLKSSGSLSRADLVEFIGLCNVAVRLPNVQKHLSSGAPLFSDLNEGRTIPFFPQERLELIQHRFIRAVGYQEDYGASEIKRIFSGLSSSKDAAFHNDDELARLFATMGATMTAAIQNATMQAMQSSLSDHDEGGSTRVVGVEYSEQIIDASSGQVLATTSTSSSSSRNQYNDNSNGEVSAEQAPTSQIISETRVEEQPSPSEWDMAKKASALHQEILGDLLSMDPEERDFQLQHAKGVAQSTMEAIQQLSPGPERVSFLQNLDMPTQRLLLMEKLWESMLQANGGKPPVMQRRTEQEGDV